MKDHSLFLVGTTARIRRFCGFFLFCFILGNSIAETPDAERGLASFYAGKFQGRTTANGEKFDTKKYTAAHKTLPFNTIVKVTNIENEKWVLVRINDRGPFVEERVIDLSRYAAARIDMVSRGIVAVTVEVISLGDGKTYHHEPPDYSRLMAIQVGAYIEHANAEKVHDLLKKHGLEPEYEGADNGITKVIVSNVNSMDIKLTRTLLNIIGFPSVLVKGR